MANMAALRLVDTTHASGVPLVVRSLAAETFENLTRRETNQSQVVAALFGEARKHRFHIIPGDALHAAYFVLNTINDVLEKRSPRLGDCIMACELLNMSPTEEGIMFTMFLKDHTIRELRRATSEHFLDTIESLISKQVTPPSAAALAGPTPVEVAVSDVFSEARKAEFIRKGLFTVGFLEHFGNSQYVQAVSSATPVDDLTVEERTALTMIYPPYLALTLSRADIDRCQDSALWASLFGAYEYGRTSATPICTLVYSAGRHLASALTQGTGLYDALLNEALAADPLGELY